MLAKCEDMAIPDNINRWVMKCIKRYGGPYEIPVKSKQSWTLMKEFLQSNVLDAKASKSKVKGCVMQGLVACCVTLESSVQEKDKIIAELQTALNESQNKCTSLEQQLTSSSTDLRMHALSLGEALLEKSQQCDQLTDENQMLKVQISNLQENAEWCRNISKSESSNLPENVNSHVLHVKPSVSDTVQTLQAAPTIVSSVLNVNGPAGTVIKACHLKPDELDIIVSEVGPVPQHDFNVFSKWFCDVLRVIDYYRLNQSDMDRVLHRSVGNGLWARVKHVCVHPLRMQDILRELLLVLYDVRSDFSLYGKFKQMQTESPYEVSYRIEKIFMALDGSNAIFEPGGEMHKHILLDSLNGYIKENILLVTPNPGSLADILLRADYMWNRMTNECVKIDVATLFKPKSPNNNHKHENNLKQQRSIVQSNVHKPFHDHKSKSKPWVPFSKMKFDYDCLTVEYKKIKRERDKLKDQVLQLTSQLQALRGSNSIVDNGQEANSDLLDV